VSDPAVDWLLSSRDHSVRYLTLVDVLGESTRTNAVRSAKEKISRGPRVRALLKGQRKDGGFGVHPYHKWTGAFWRLVSLIELEVPRSDPRLRRAANQVLDWLDSGPLTNTVNGRARIHASIPGNAIGVCTRLGMSGDARVRRLVDVLLETQWPDGGWNCDQKPKANHSSFYESLATLWGLIEYSKATGDSEASQAAERATELFLEHQLFRSTSSGDVINQEWLKLHYPLYWHYDILQALVILSRRELLSDPRAKEALDIIESKRDKQGLWRSEGYFWRPLTSTGSASGGDAPRNEVVDWGRRGPNEMITLNALRVLRASGRLR
jgi:hypothetical protein